MTLCLPPASMLVSCLAYSLTLKMEVICSSDTSIDIQWTTWCYIPDESTLHIRGLLQKSWQHYFSEILKALTGISKFAAEREQRLISNDAAR
jgi:hypothetical protein